MSAFPKSFSSRIALLAVVAFIAVLGVGRSSTAESGAPRSATASGERLALQLKPSAMALAPMMAVFSVDRLDDPSPAAAFSACTAAANDCSLRGAVIAANTLPGSTISLGAGTHVLSIAGNDALSNLGDLDVRGNNTVIIGTGAGSTTIQQTVADRVIEVNPTGGAAFNFSISGVTITGGNLTTGSGGGILGGGSLNTMTVSNCAFTGNIARSNGGAISFSANSVIPLTVTDSTFANNTAQTGVGGAISYSGSGTFTVQRSVFTSNTATANSGGAINATGGGTGIFNISQSSFVSNTVGGTGRGGAISKVNGLLNVSYSRFVLNTAAIAANGNHIGILPTGIGSNSIDDNWWGLSAGPGANGISGGMATTWLELRLAANPNSVCPGGTSALTADIYGRSMGGTVPGCPGLACPLNGLPAFPVPATTLFSATNGTISADGTQFVDGAASATFTASATSGSASVTADNQTLVVPISVEAPTTSDPADQTICQGTTATFSTTSSGSGSFTYVWKQGSTVLNNGDLGGRVAITSTGNTSSLSISGTVPGDSGTYTVEATGGCGTDTQSASLTVRATTTTTDPPDQSVCGGATANFTTTASGTGPFTFVWKQGATVLNNGDLGGRVTITNGATTSTLSISNAQPGDAGTYTVETSGACNTASQSANLAVDAAPPTLVLNADASLWPPTHAYSTFNISTIVASTNDACDGNVINNVVITSVSSDESENGNGDGNTSNDIVIAADCKSVNLRAERQTTGNGRVYRINLKVTDSQGNTTTATYKVFVKKTQNGAPAVDDGPAAGYTVASLCP